MRNLYSCPQDVKGLVLEYGSSTNMKLGTLKEMRY